MSDFKLDVDFPVEVIHADSLESHPDKLPYTAENIHRRHYGKYLELMVDKAVEMEAGEEKDELIMLIANHMKKLMLAVSILLCAVWRETACTWPPLLNERTWCAHSYPQL